MRKSEARELKKSDRVALHDGAFVGYVDAVTEKLFVVQWDDGDSGIFYFDDYVGIPDGIKYLERVARNA